MQLTAFRLKNLVAIRHALDGHNATCPEPCEAILLHPFDHGLLPWHELWGVPVLADESVRVKHIRIECRGDGRSSEQPGLYYG